MPKREPRTLLELCVANAGLIKGSRIAEFVVAWAIASRAMNREINAEDLSEWWGKGFSRRNVYYRLDDFRKAFPQLKDPQTLANAINQQVADRELKLTRRDVSAAASLPLDVPLLA